MTKMNYNRGKWRSLVGEFGTENNKLLIILGNKLWTRVRKYTSDPLFIDEARLLRWRHVLPDPFRTVGVELVLDPIFVARFPFDWPILLVRMTWSNWKVWLGRGRSGTYLILVRLVEVELGPRLICGLSCKNRNGLGLNWSPIWDNIFESRFLTPTLFKSNYIIL